LEQFVSHEPAKRRQRPREYTLLLVGLPLFILAGVLGALFLPRLLFSHSVMHPPLLNTSRALQGDYSPLWLDKHTVFLETTSGPSHLWNLSTNTWTEKTRLPCVPAPLMVMNMYTGLYDICMFDDGTIQAISILRGTQTIDYNGHYTKWPDLILSNDGTKVAAISDQEVFQIWDLAGHHLLYHLAGPSLSNQVGLFSWSSDSTHLGYVNSTYEQTIADIWDMSTGNLSITDHLSVFNALTQFQLLAGSQSFLLRTENSQFALVSAVTHRVLLSQSPSNLTLSFQISPDTKLLELNKGGSTTIEIYDGATGQKLTTYPGLARSLGIRSHTITLGALLGV
jgi:WD40 repeat protein